MEEVAYLTLIKDEGVFDQAAYSAALQARYPRGTPINSLLGYVKQAKGTCNENPIGRLWCEIPIKGGLCWAQLIGLDVGVVEDTVTDIKVQIGGLTC